MISIRNLSEIECFLVVASCESFSVAAQRLHLSKNSVSRFVMNLEERLGEKLLRRTTRRVYLTSFGEYFLGEAQAFWNCVEQLETRLAKANAEPGGTIRMIASEVFADLFLHKRLRAYRQLCPQVKLKISYSEDEAWDLAVKDTNILFGYAHMPRLTSQWRSRCLGVVQHCLAASPQLLAQYKPIAGAQDLPALPYLSHVARQSSSSFLLHNGKAIPTAKPSIVVDSFRQLNALACLGLGVVLTARELIADDLASGRLIAVLPDLPYQSFELHAFCRPDEYKLARIRAFMDCPD